MKRIAILGGGIAGLAAAYELELARKRGADLDWTLYEASHRLGGTVETTRQAGFILEGGPDAWVTEKPWAHDLAVELGLESALISSNDATRKTYILVDGALHAMPDRMRMMVPEDLATLDDCALFSAEARAAYAAELANATQLREAAPQADESVASFVRRHFGEEVLDKIGAPLLSGVFGGDVEKLSVQSVMPAFVAMEREHGSLIAAVQAKAAARSGKPAQPTFTSLRNGVGSLVEALIATLPPDRLQMNRSALSLKREGKLWCVRTSTLAEKGRLGKAKKHFHHVLLATPAHVTRSLLQPLDPQAAALIPEHASSAVLATFAWPAAAARTFTVPPGFGFLVPQSFPDDHSYPGEHCHPEQSEGCASRSLPHNSSSFLLEGAGGFSPLTSPVATGASAPGSPPPRPQILACTFVDQKFPDRAPAGARLIRVFFGGSSFDHFTAQSDAEVAATAFMQLQAILGPLPAPDAALTTVRRWPRSLPQYEVGHPTRLADLDRRIASLGGLSLLGNAYRGVGLPDLIRDARAAARTQTTNN